MSGMAAVLIVTVVILLLMITGSWTISSFFSWRSAEKQAIALGRRKRPKLATPPFMCCSCLSLTFGLIALFAVQQLRSDVSLFAYDPWRELELDSETMDESVIKKQYRRLSLKHHPDKPGGDAKKFQKISRAYNALTDPKARDNFLQFGNPEGTYLNLAEMPDWLGGGGPSAVNAKDASKRKAGMVMVGLLAVLLSVPLMGMCIVKNRNNLNSLETGGADGDRVEALSRNTSATQRKEMLRKLTLAYQAGEMDDDEYEDWKDMLAEAEKRAAAAVAAGGGGKKGDAGKGKNSSNGSTTPTTPSKPAAAATVAAAATTPGGSSSGSGSGSSSAAEGKKEA